eukprot:7157893-Pyramimonas_sp.AAC.1
MAQARRGTLGSRARAPGSEIQADFETETGVVERVQKFCPSTVPQARRLLLCVREIPVAALATAILLLAARAQLAAIVALVSLSLGRFLLLLGGGLPLSSSLCGGCLLLRLSGVLHPLLLVAVLRSSVAVEERGGLEGRESESGGGISSGRTR